MTDDLWVVEYFIRPYPSSPHKQWMMPTWENYGYPTIGSLEEVTKTAKRMGDWHNGIRIRHMETDQVIPLDLL